MPILPSEGRGEAARRKHYIYGDGRATQRRTEQPSYARNTEKHTDASKTDGHKHDGTRRRTRYGLTTGRAQTPFDERRVLLCPATCAEQLWGVRRCVPRARPEPPHHTENTFRDGADRNSCCFVSPSPVPFHGTRAIVACYAKRYLLRSLCTPVRRTSA